MKHLPVIMSAVIPHKSQRYDTAGDYYKEDGIQVFAISKMNADREFMVLVHEIIEWYLTEKRGIKEKDITKFDTLDVEPKYESDPGMSPKAPYHKEHLFSTKIEKMLCKELGLDWKEYDKSFETLKY